jgi:hypothetical protein
VTHAALVERAVEWLRTQYRCGIVLSEQACASGEVPDAIGWKGKNRSVVVECKSSRADFLADRNKPWRVDPETALGSERLYMAPVGVIRPEEIPQHWGLLECAGRRTVLRVKPSRKDLRSPVGLMNEMNLILASLRRVEIRIEPQTITDFLKWKNRLAQYNGGVLPEGITEAAQEQNVHLEAVSEGV